MISFSDTYSNFHAEAHALKQGCFVTSMSFDYWMFHRWLLCLCSLLSFWLYSLMDALCDLHILFGSRRQSQYEEMLEILCGCTGYLGDQLCYRQYRMSSIQHVLKPANYHHLDRSTKCSKHRISTTCDQLRSQGHRNSW